MTPKEQEDEFQRLYDIWINTQDRKEQKKAFDLMFIRILEVCKAIGKKINTAPNNPFLEERCLDAAIYFANRIKTTKIRPNKLSSWCYLGVKGFLYRPLYIREDREESYEEIFEEWNDES